MPTQRLILFFALVAVAGGCSIWYTKMILPASVPEPVFENSAPVAVPKTDTKKPAVVTPAVSKPVTAVPTAVTPATVPTAAVANDMTSDIDAIAASADAAYDDSSLEADVTSASPASLTTSYGI